MRFILTVVFIVAGISSTVAQDRLSLKLFQNTDWFEMVEKNVDTRTSATSRQWNISRLSIAVEFRKSKKWTHEFELCLPQLRNQSRLTGYPVNYSSYTGPFETSISSIALRYQVVKGFGDRSARVRPVAGIGLNPYYLKVASDAIDERYADRSWTHAGMAVFASAGLQFRLTSRLGAEISLPLKLYDLRYTEQWAGSPVLNIREQTYGDFEHKFFETCYTLRAGLTFKL